MGYLYVKKSKMTRECVTIFLSIYLLRQISILSAYTIACNASIQTINRVTRCPSKNSYEAAVAKKNCSSLAADAQACSSFQYHCVLGDDKKNAVEVCAPSINIIGHVCAMFSSERKGIMRVDGLNCSRCQYSYNSTNAFIHTECYKNKGQTSATEPPIRTINDGATYAISISISVFVIIALAVTIFVKRKQIRQNCLRDRRQSSVLRNRHGFANNDDIIPGQSEPFVPVAESSVINANYTEDIEMKNRDIQRRAIVKTIISTTKKEDNLILQTEVNYVLDTLRNPDESWTKKELVETVDDMINKLVKREEIDLLKDLCTAITEDKNINMNLRSCQKKMCKILNSTEKKYHAKINVSKGCVCLTFCFDTDNDLKSFLVKVQEEKEELGKDISALLLNKELMDVFHVDALYVSLIISKISINKGTVLLYQEDFLNSTMAEDGMRAEDNIREDIMKKDIPEGRKIRLESNFNSVLSSMKNPKSMQEKVLISLVEDMVYEVIANKRTDLLQQFATAYKDEETKNALHQYGANMHRTLIPIFKDINVILNVTRKRHLTITEKDEDDYGEAVANRFSPPQISQYIGYKDYKTRALSFSTAATWMIHRKQEFAKLGFFKGGIDLNTICFHCGCSKDDWTQDDDILATHLSLTEFCAYVNYMVSALPLTY